MNDYVKGLEAVFYANQNLKYAESMKKYMQNNFEFIGLQKPLRASLQKPFLERHNLPEIQSIPEIILFLWQLPEREFQYFALALLEKFLAIAPRNFIELFETLILTKSWWDTVDMLASKFVGTIFFNDIALRKQYLEKWDSSDNLWIKRTCLLFQLNFKEKTDTELLETLIHKMIPSPEFFINKAIGWILREYSKTNSSWVIAFVENTNLANLSRREALKWLTNQGKI
jgi:3-methyladenine DNA glycosylase AlkD